MDKKEQLVLIDGNSLINRAYYALPYLTNKDGVPSGAVYGFATMLVRMIEEYSPKYIAVAFDMKAKTFRHEMYDGYKATRKGMPDDLAAQMPILKEMLTTMGIKYIEQEGIEADDIVGTLAKSHPVATYILTGDRDSFQLIDDSTSVLFTRKGISEVDVMTKETLMTAMGLTPSQIVDYKSLAGDASDNIPGVQGIGDKTATLLLQKYGDVSGVYEHLSEIAGRTAEKLTKGEDDCKLSYALARIKTDCDVDTNLFELEYPFPFSRDVMAFFEKMDFRSITRRAELFGEAVSTVSRPPVRIIKISSIGQLNVILSDVKEFGFAIGENYSLSSDGRVQYDISVQRSLLDAALPESETVAALAGALSDPSVKKYVYDAKKMKKYLAPFGVELRGYEDVALMEYLGEKGKLTSASGYAESIGLQKTDGAAALILGGKEFEKNNGKNIVDLYRNVELPLVEVLYDMERIGFRVDLKLLTELKAEYNEKERSCAENIYRLTGKTFNINSPKQLGKVLFEDLGIKFPKRGKTISTSAEILEQIKDKHPAVAEVLRYRFIAKINSTYITGLEKVAGKDGVVHTEFNQMQTSTGRLSSSDPNLQNIPVREDDGKVLRGLFIAQEGHSLISADYSQIELRVMAHLSGDKNLIAAYKNGEDIHSSVAVELFGNPTPTDKERRIAKTVNFGIIYGMSAFGLAERLGIYPKEAREYIEKYFMRFPSVKEYLDGVVESAKKTGYAESLFGRRRFIPELRSSNFQQRAFGERAAMNMPLQSTAADIIKIAMLKVYDALKKTSAKLILQVHDELIVDAPSDEVPAVSEILRREMETAVTLNVPLTVQVGVGKTWLSCK